MKKVQLLPKKLNFAEEIEARCIRIGATGIFKIGKMFKKIRESWIWLEIQLYSMLIPSVVSPQRNCKTTFSKNVYLVFS